MLCAYPPDDARDDYPDIDKVKFYIQSKCIPGLNKKKIETSNLASQLTANKNTVTQQLDQFNSSTLTKAVLGKKLTNSSSSVAGSGIKVTGTLKWVDNLPFSKQCLAFEGKSTDAKIKITPPQALKALSCGFSCRPSKRKLAPAC